MLYMLDDEVQTSGRSLPQRPYMLAVDWVVLTATACDKRTLTAKLLYTEHALH